MVLACRTAAAEAPVQPRAGSRKQHCTLACRHIMTCVLIACCSFDALATPSYLFVASKASACTAAVWTAAIANTCLYFHREQLAGYFLCLSQPVCCRSHTGCPCKHTGTRHRYLDKVLHDALAVFHAHEKQACYDPKSFIIVTLLTSAPSRVIS